MTDWRLIKTPDELEAFYTSIIPKIRKVARQHGYAIGVHGSLRRDLDLIAVPWSNKYSDKQILSEAIQKAACGLVSTDNRWESKPNGRCAISLACCCPEWYDQPGAGHIDLSVISSNPIS